MNPEITKAATQVATEVANEAYKDVAKPAMKSVGDSLALIPRAINAALLPVYDWVAHREYQIERTKKLLEMKLRDVQPEDVVPPEPHIAVPALQAISYSMDSSEIRGMYANLLAASMTKNRKGEVHPSYVEFIKQMAPDEARILRHIYLHNHGIIPVVTLRLQHAEKGGIDIVPYFTNLYRTVEDLEFCSFETTAISVDNLVRLKLLQIHDGSHLTAPGSYDELEQDTALTKIKNSYSLPPEHSWKYTRTYLSITSLGKSFCAICIAPQLERGH